MSKKSELALGIIILVIGLVLISMPVVSMAPQIRAVAAGSFIDRISLTGGYEQELQNGEHITVVDEKSGAVVDKTARVVYTGDEFITEENEHFRITRVRGNKAIGKRLGKARDIVWRDEWEAAPAAVAAKAAQAQGGKTQIAIYHTHTGESYVPTEGTENIPAKGGILKVGSSLANALQQQGVTVIDDKTPHEPHDANAYHRSRRTAVKLLKERPLALLDVHRDGVPDPEFYRKDYNGKPITKIRLVVGRQNPHMATNLAFAKQVKAYMDKTKPGLIKGIFIGRGNYNQDLAPRALLLEVGTHTNERFRAQQGAAVFAEAFPAILNIKPAAQPGPGAGKTDPYLNTSQESTGAWSTIGWIIGILLVGGIAFLFISTGSIKGMSSKLGELRKTEFANFFGLKRAGKKSREKENK